MTLRKLAAGSGYTYLTRQVAAHDTIKRGQLGLAAYYKEKGEAPGRWMGSGLGGLDLADGDLVTEEQMKLLFGRGWHRSPRSRMPSRAAGVPSDDPSRPSRRPPCARRSPPPSAHTTRREDEPGTHPSRPGSGPASGPRSSLAPSPERMAVLPVTTPS